MPGTQRSSGRSAHNTQKVEQRGLFAQLALLLLLHHITPQPPPSGFGVPTPGALCGVGSSLSDEATPPTPAFATLASRKGD